MADADAFVVVSALRRHARGWWLLFGGLILLGAALPLVLAAATGRLVDIARTIDQGDASRLTLPLVIVGVSFLLSQAHAAWLEASGYVLGRLLQQTLSEEVMRIAMQPAGIAHLEDPSVADELDRSRELGQGWNAGEAPFSLGVVGAAYLRAVLSLIVLLVIAPIVAVPALIGWAAVSRFRKGTMRLFMKRLEGQAQGLRRAKYLRELVIGGGAAKESRIFGLTAFLAGKHREAWFSGMESIFDERKRHDRSALPLIAVFAVGVGSAIWWVADAGFSGQLSMTEVILGIQAIAALQGFNPGGDEVWQLQLGAKVMRNARNAARIAEHASAALAGSRAVTEPPHEAIRFEDVTFAYPNTAVRILDGLDLEIPAGGSLAIVGANGAGKTTLTKLLARLYDPTSGRITIDGVDLRELSPAAWRRQIGVIFQDFVRFELSARDNIALGAPHLDDEDAIRRAARLAGASSALDATGWDATLSRAYAGGADLSGGQWQRVALARALYAVEGGARILILDEPTANLDVRAEAALYDRFLEVTRGVTTILISHRFSTVRLADRIAVIEAGRVTELGSHAELLAAGGLYAEMFTAQASAYVENAAIEEALS
jgi:ATP-binding cassette subfamily B protein